MVDEARDENGRRSHCHCDAVFVTRLVDQTTVRSYYPPTAPHYAGWYDYYSRAYAYAASPGYTVENQVVNFETNLYRVSDGRLVWSALSRERLELSEAPGERIDPFVRAKGAVERVRAGASGMKRIAAPMVGGMIKGASNPGRGAAAVGVPRLRCGRRTGPE